MVPEKSLTKTLKKTAILTGTTASGKTAIAVEFARARGKIELINADSLLVYRGMDIGTAKPTREELTEIPHHLIDIREPDQSFTAGDFHREAIRAIHDIESRGKRALIVGGTGFYLKALLYGLWEAPKTDPALRQKLEALDSAELYARLEKHDSASALRIGQNDRYRLIRANEILELTGLTPTELEKARPEKADPRFELLVIDRENDELYARIAARTRAMLQQGLVEEVKSLRHRFGDIRALAAVGYTETIAFLDGKLPEGRKVPPGVPGLQSEIELSTRQLVKRQRTWFRGQTEAEILLLDRDHSKLMRKLEAVYET